MICDMSKTFNLNFKAEKKNQVIHISFVKIGLYSISRTDESLLEIYITNDKKIVSDTSKYFFAYLIRL